MRDIKPKIKAALYVLNKNSISNIYNICKCCRRFFHKGILHVGNIISLYSRIKEAIEKVSRVQLSAMEDGGGQ